MMNNGSVNWPEFFNTANSLKELVEDVMLVKPELVDYPWMNATLWSDMLDRVGIQLSSTSPEKIIEQ